MRMPPTSSDEAAGGDAVSVVSVALVLVSHSMDLAAGTVALAGQMAPRVAMIPAGGTDEGGLGTSFELVTEALDRASADGRSVVVLTDLGSAVLTTETVLEFADDAVAARVRIADAPFVEGAVAAAVAAEGGADVASVLEAAERAGSQYARTAPDLSLPSTPAWARVPSGLRASAVLRNPLGLHARPAAQLARTASGFDAAVTVDGVDAASVLALIGLGTVGGREVTVTATGPQARAALAAVVDEIESGFGEA
ncbi:dihydroxyacetone kinase phosphoryl donor subunit DhaM [Pengzhenrongella sp.]|uniref:dihydroxyacetone kinase phosphoryl donor subunit DhaM n=1 Tax=Pengzhenrongella sp. TaxID=2888820 RepID=UPI002F95B74A